MFTAASYGTNHTNSTGTSPNFFASSLIDVSFNTDRVAASSRTVNQGTTINNVQVSNDYVPDVEKKYKIRIRLVNLATAPVSSTDFRIHMIKIVDHTRLSVDFGTIGGSGNVSDAAPVRVLSSAALTATATITGGQAAHSSASTGTPVRIG